MVVSQYEVQKGQGERCSDYHCFCQVVPDNQMVSLHPKHLWALNIGVTQELVRNMQSQPPPQTD